MTCRDVTQDLAASRKLRAFLVERCERRLGGGRLRDHDQPESGNQPRPHRAEHFAQQAAHAIANHRPADAAARDEADAAIRITATLEHAEHEHFAMHRFALRSHSRKFSRPDEPGSLWKSQARLPPARSSGRGDVGHWSGAQASV